MIKEVAEFIESKVIALVIGENFFVGHRPQRAPAICDVILESAGGTVYFELPERADIVFQILSRAETYFDARTRAYVIYDAIFRSHTAPDALGLTYGSAGWPIGPVEVGGDKYEIMVLEPLALPQYIGPGEKDIYEFSVNYLMKIKKL